MPMEEIGADSCDRTAAVERHGPESPNMVAARELVFVHESERSRKRLGEGDALVGQPFREAFDQEFQHIAAPGKMSPISCLGPRGEEFRLPFGKIGFDGPTDMFWSERAPLIHDDCHKAGSVPCRISLAQGSVTS